GGGELGVPQGDQRHRDEAVGCRAAPFLDHPVVVGAYAVQGEVLVGGLGEGLSAVAGEGGEDEGGVDAGGVHVADTGGEGVAAADHVVVVAGDDLGSGCGELLGEGAAGGAAFDGGGDLLVLAAGVAAVAVEDAGLDRSLHGQGVQPVVVGPVQHPVPLHDV